MNITLKDLLDAGVHFGHQVRRFNPKAKRFVYDNRHGISIIDLEKTYAQLEKAADFLRETTAAGKQVLFVGTKRQAEEIVREAAINCQMPFCANRWLGGALTNWNTVKNSIGKYKRYLEWEGDGTLAKMHKKEAAVVRREMSRMHRNFEGMLELNGPPAAMVVVDTRNETIAVAEANRLGIPVVGIVDTNADPSVIDYPVPGNDDSIKSIRLMIEVLMEAILEGVQEREARLSQPVNAPGEAAAAGVAAPATEEQLPVTRRGRGRAAAPAEAGGSDDDDDIPTSFSTDDDSGESADKSES